MSSEPPAYQGIVRQARRPAGWQAPGPQPAGPGEREDLWPGAKEDLCYLAGDWRIFQRLDGHRWSLDDLVTAAYALEALDGDVPTRHMDLGCGIGSVLMMIAWACPHTPSLGIEAQGLSAAMARRSLAYNGAQKRVQVLDQDLRDVDALPWAGECDLVTGTPPYFATANGVVSENVQRGPCRFETRGGVEAYALAAARVMSNEGLFVFCETAGESSRVHEACEQAQLSVVRQRDVIPKAGKQPLLTLFRAVRHGAHSADEFTEDPALIVRDAADARTPDFIEIRERLGIPP